MGGLWLSGVNPAGEEYGLLLSMVPHVVSQSCAEASELRIRLEKMILIELEELLQLLLQSSLK
jgi:hypothetical protein